MTTPSVKKPEVHSASVTPDLSKKSWKLCGLRDTRENVSESVAAAAFVPAGAKAMLVEMINDAFPKARLLSLDAHVHVFERNKKPIVDVAITISEL